MQTVLWDRRTEDFSKDIAKDVETVLDTSKCSKDENRLLPVGKNKKVIDMMQDDLGKKIWVWCIEDKDVCI